MSAIARSLAWFDELLKSSSSRSTPICASSYEASPCASDVPRKATVSPRRGIGDAIVLNQLVAIMTSPVDVGRYVGSVAFVS